MKGFPNQIAEFEKLVKGIAVLAELVDGRKKAKDYGVFGEALVRSGVAGTGHTPKPVEDYLREQRLKAPDRQSFQTTARGLRELYRLLEFIDDSGDSIVITPLGREAATFSGKSLDDRQKNFAQGRLDELPTSAATTKRLTRIRCCCDWWPVCPVSREQNALALEAINDSPEELERIVALAQKSEGEIIKEIGVSQSNWDNAKKVLPKFAEQLGDVFKDGQMFFIADAPGRGSGDENDEVPAAPTTPKSRVPRTPRASRQVTPTTIGRAGTTEEFDDVIIPRDIDPAAQAKAIKTRQKRLRRHNMIVQKLAARLADSGPKFYEDPFDVLTIFSNYGILGEIKTLDGTVEDERERVRDALSQLLYYEAFVIRPIVGETAIRKIACFESQITKAHQKFLNDSRIGTIWQEGDGFAGDALAVEYVGDLLKELRG